MLTIKNKVMKIRTNAEQVLRENYNNSNKEISFAEWVKIEAQNDPNFFRWLFETDIDADFFNPDKKAFENFLHSITATAYEVNVRFEGSNGWQTICKCATMAEAEAEIEHQRTIEDEGDCEYKIVEIKQ